MDDNLEEILEECSVNSSSFKNLQDRLRFNNTISQYYDMLYDEEFRPYEVNDSGDNHKILRISDRVRACSHEWEIAYKKKLKIKQLKKTNLCRDKFCINCASALAKAREHKYVPLLEDYFKTNSVYHCVFTVPNCKGSELLSVRKLMSKKFGYFLNYLAGRKKIGRKNEGFDLSYLGFIGGIKSFEVTYNEKKDTYHPHYHCLMVMNNDLKLDKVHVNKFSYSYDDDHIDKYSSEEILFQRLWYLIYNGIKVCEENIDSSNEGYSVYFNRAEPKDCKEIFKYPFKGNFNEETCLKYLQFKVYQKALKGGRMIDGYGCFRKVNFEDDDLTSDDLEISVRELMCELDKQEESETIFETSKELVKNLQKGYCRYITTGSIKKFFMTPEDRLTDESKEILEQFKANVESRER